MKVVTASPGTAKETAPDLAMRMLVSNLNFYYGKSQALFNVNLRIATNQVTALIGPSGCGKSTLLRTLNRMHETLSDTRLTGEITLDGEDILRQDVNTPAPSRRNVVPAPESISKINL